MPTATLRAVKHGTLLAVDQLGGTVVRDASRLAEMLKHARGAAA
jgi:mannose/fructose-specific phosphotransferase system component IIA